MLKIEKMDVLLALYITALISAELLGSKVATVAGINFSVGLFALPITFTINDIVAEVHGKERASSFVKVGFLMLLVLFGLTALSVVLPPAGRFQAMNPSYVKLFSQSTRIILASLTSFFFSEKFDVMIYQRIKQKFGMQNLWLRNNLSNFMSQLIDTVLFMMLAFYHPGNFGFIVSLIWPYWLLKCAFSVAETPFTYLGVDWLRKNLPAKHEAKA